ncbi:MAG: efflux RND transporter periplasmic adaptor subunit [Betaproteobacteria bacterium]
MNPFSSASGRAAARYAVALLGLLWAVGAAQARPPVAAAQGEVSAGTAAGTAAGATATAERRSVASHYVADAVIEAVRQATVSAQLPGQITQYYVDAGDRVRRGQLLARIDAREADAQLAAGAAQVTQAEAQLAQARLNHERTARLVQQDFVSQAALDRAEADLKTAAAALEVARAGRTVAGRARDHAEVRAPIDGVVTRRLLEPGELAQPGRPVLELHDPVALRAVGSVPQHVLAAVQRAAQAGALAGTRVELPALGLQLAAQRVTVLPATDARQLATAVRAELPAPLPAGLVPGTTAKLRLPIGQTDRLVVPPAAILRRSELTAVIVVAADGRRVLRQVRTGEHGADWIEILTGLDPGETVALDPQRGTSGARGAGTAAAR